MARAKTPLEQAADDIALTAFDAAFDAAWEEFIRVCDELDWDSERIAQYDTKAKVLASIRALWEA